MLCLLLGDKSRSQCRGDTPKTPSFQNECVAKEVKRLSFFLTSSLTGKCHMMLHPCWTSNPSGRVSGHEGSVVLAKKQLRRKKKLLSEDHFYFMHLQSRRYYEQFQTHDRSFQQSWTVNHQLQRHTQQVERYCTTVLTHSDTFTTARTTAFTAQRYY